MMTAMAASPDSRYIATGSTDGTVIIWRGATGPQKMLLEMPRFAESKHVFSLHFSDTSEFLAGICAHNLLIWRVIDGVQVTSVPGTGRQTSCAWLRQSHDDLTLSVVEWRLHKEQSASLLVTKVHVLHSGTMTASDPVFLLAHDHIPAPHKNKLEYALGITQSSSGLWVAVWTTAEPACYLWQLVDSIPAYVTYQLNVEHPRSSASCARFIGDIQLVLGLYNGDIWWWDISSSPLSTVEVGGVLPLFHEEVHGLSISPLHSFLLAWSFNIVSVVRRTTTRTAQDCLAHDFSLHIILHGHEDQVKDGCFSPCERYIATASHDFTVRLWSTRDGELLWTFRDHDNMVTEVVFSPDGRVLASVDDDGRVRIRPLSMFVRDVPVSSVNNT